MDRDEHLHIRKSVLTDVLSQIDYSKKMSPNQLADAIMDASKNKGVKDFYRKFLGVKAKTRDKLKRTMDAEVPNVGVEEFNRVLVNFRMAHKNKYSRAPIRIIKKDDSDYLLLKEVAKMAQDFVTDFDITSKNEGYTEYLEIGYYLMGKKFFLNKYKTYNKKIREIFRAKVDCIMDEDPEGTKQIYAYWQQYMVEYADLGDLINIEGDYFKYVNLVYAREMADDLKADYEDWVVSQFEGLTFLNAIPEIYQFHGDGAKTRYERYLKDTVDFSQEEKNTLTNFHKKGNHGDND